MKFKTTLIYFIVILFILEACEATKQRSSGSGYAMSTSGSMMMKMKHAVQPKMSRPKMNGKKGGKKKGGGGGGGKKKGGGGGGGMKKSGGHKKSGGGGGGKKKKC